MAREAGTGLGEMDLQAQTEEDDPTGEFVAIGADRSGSPIENPTIDPITDDPLLLPHPNEPGVLDDGTAAPLENPDDSVSADPLAGER